MSTRQTERWSSWFKAPVLKIGIRVSVSWVRIPPSPPNKALCLKKRSALKKWRHTQAGRRGQFAKLLGFARAARVRIPLSPPKKLFLYSFFFLCVSNKNDSDPRGQRPLIKRFSESFLES